jgi:hypothetical protein
LIKPFKKEQGTPLKNRKPNLFNSSPKIFVSII